MRRRCLRPIVANDDSIKSSQTMGHGWRLAGSMCAQKATLRRILLDKRNWVLNCSGFLVVKHRIVPNSSLSKPSCATQVSRISVGQANIRRYNHCLFSHSSRSKRHSCTSLSAVAGVIHGCPICLLSLTHVLKTWQATPCHSQPALQKEY